MKTCYIVRHADKQAGDFYNPDLRHQDQPISEQGRQEASRLCAFFENKPVAAIYVSEYRRTWQTIEPVASILGLSPRIDRRLNEFDNGLFEGLDPQAIEKAYPAEWQAYLARTADFQFPGGESGSQAQARIVSFLQDKHLQHPDQEIVVVCHDGLIRLLMCWLVKLPVYLRGHFQVSTCGLLEIRYQPRYDSWKIIHFNQVFSA